ncbi:MAG: hypothetical protein JNK82_21475 [Myxococcaceae bacterium]|nr:hypothetical protein [Myxococcaceae bacterium]
MKTTIEDRIARPERSDREADAESKGGGLCPHEPGSTAALRERSLLELPGLRSLTMFGSCLSPHTRTATSIPDWFAVVDDVGVVLRALGHGAFARAVARFLPPAVVVPKLNLVAPEQLAEALAARDDLYLAGRLGKRTQLVFARDALCAAQLDAATATARATMAEVALWGLPRDVPLEHVLLRCISLSYDAEVRPELPHKIRALFDAFAPWYREQYVPLLVHRVRGDRVVDDRPDAVRANEARGLRRLLFRSRLRAVARWPKNLVLYDRALEYLAGKLRRSRALPRDLHVEHRRLEGAVQPHPQR